jgi:hypothetical protein
MTLEGVGKPPAIIEWEDLDFEPVSEGWNRYMVEDGTLLKIRFVLLKIRRKVTLGPPAPIPYGLPQEPNFNTNSTNLLAVIAPNKLKGSPVQNFVPPPPEQLAKIPKEVLDFTTYAEPWNTYRLKDGQVIKIKLNVSAIARFKDLYDGNGDPFYLVHSGTTFIPVPKEMEVK